MASTGNAFDLLVGAGEQPSAGKKKANKKKAKSKKEGAAIAAPNSDGQAGPAPVVVSAAAKEKAPASIDIAEACDMLESSARQATSRSERVNTWGAWIKQVRVGCDH